MMYRIHEKNLSSSAFCVCLHELPLLVSVWCQSWSHFSSHKSPPLSPVIRYSPLFQFPPTLLLFSLFFSLLSSHSLNTPVAGSKRSSTPMDMEKEHAHSFSSLVSVHTHCIFWGPKAGHWSIAVSNKITHTALMKNNCLLKTMPENWSLATDHLYPGGQINEQEKISGREKND